MHFKPVDEMSLRHLFSSRYAENILRMSYLGPVRSSSNSIESSPDCLIVDKGESPWKIWRCEFKYFPSGKNDFEHNGQFDIAILWSLPTNLRRQELEKELLSQNGCHRVIVLTDYKGFRDLKEYHIPDSDELNGIDKLRHVLLKSKTIKPPSVFAAYIAASIYPEYFDMKKVVTLLSNKFPEVRKMQPKGRSVVVSKLLQTKPPLIQPKYSSYYCWTDTINADMAIGDMLDLLTNIMHIDIPTEDMVNSVK